MNPEVLAVGVKVVANVMVPVFSCSYGTGYLAMILKVFILAGHIRGFQEP